MKIVQDREEARKASKAEAKSDLLSDPEIVQTTFVQAGDQASIYNRLPARLNERRTVDNKFNTRSSKSAIAAMLATLANNKPLQNITLSGVVDADGISEVWWKEGDLQYRIFTNANFLHLTSAGTFEDEDYRYNTFLVINPRPNYINTGDMTANDAESPWRPTLADFTPGLVEYYLVEPQQEAEALSETTTAAATADPEATEYTQSAGPSQSDIEAGLTGLEAMLRYYADHSEQLEITYQNRKQIAAARKEYLENNPRTKGTEIINFRPILASEKRSLQSHAAEDDRQFTIHQNNVEDSLQLQWTGVDSMFYFIEKCSGLGQDKWEIAPFALKSEGEVEGAVLQTNVDKMFFRLVETEDHNDDNMQIDSDFDGISNGSEDL